MWHDNLLQMSQGNVVASFLASVFNEECAERGITEVGYGHTGPLSSVIL